MKINKITVLICSTLMFGNAVASTEIDKLEARITELESSLAETKEVAETASEQSSSFEYSGYARAGFLTNDSLNGAETSPSPYMAPAGALGGAIGRLGVEDDNYVEATLIHNRHTESGASSRYVVTLTDGVRTSNTWTSEESSLNVGEVYAELSGLSIFSGALENATIWGGKRWDRDNYDIHFIDSDIVFLAGTGAGIYDVQFTDSWKSNFSVYSNTFDETDDDQKVESYTASMNNFVGNWQLMLNAIIAKDNNELDTNQAESGFTALFAYHSDNFYGVSKGFSKTGIQVGSGLGADVKNLGQVSALNEDAMAYRAFTYGVGEIADGWRIAPSLVAEKTSDLTNDHDDNMWVTLNVRLAQEFNENFEMVYEGSYQYSDLEHDQNNKGSFYKFAIAPTIKLSNLDEGFFDRPELRFTASYVDWSDDFNKNMGDGGEVLFGVQMETWF